MAHHTLNADDYARLAELHRASLPDSAVTLMGPAYTRAFYRYVQRSAHEMLLFRRHEGRVAGGCVVSSDPDGLTKRLALKTPLLPHALMRAPVLPWKKLLFTPKSDEVSEEPTIDIDGLPELLIIYTDPEARGLGLGVEMVAECEERLAAQGVREYMLKTIDDEANPAFRFYAKRGLTMRHSIVKQGRRFRVWTKPIGSAAP